MKYRYELQSRIVDNEYVRDWYVIASSPVSPKTAIANYKKSTGRWNSIENQKERGVEFRMVTIEIQEREVKYEDI